MVRSKNLMLMFSNSSIAVNFKGYKIHNWRTISKCRDAQEQSQTGAVGTKYTNTTPQQCTFLRGCARFPKIKKTC
jgi:hypothetical protein